MTGSGHFPITLGDQAEVSNNSLARGQSLLVAIIRELGFGRIEGLSIRAGQPAFEPAPRIVQSIKLNSDARDRLERPATDSGLKKEFQALFKSLNELSDGTVDIEVRHSAPFRLVLQRRLEEIL